MAPSWLLAPYLLPPNVGCPLHQPRDKGRELGRGERKLEGGIIAETDQEQATEVKIDPLSRGGAKRERKP